MHYLHSAGHILQHSVFGNIHRTHSLWSQIHLHASAFTLIHSQQTTSSFTHMNSIHFHSLALLQCDMLQHTRELHSSQSHTRFSNIHLHSRAGSFACIHMHSHAFTRIHILVSRGPIQGQQHLLTFVNIRCMQLNVVECGA